MEGLVAYSVVGDTWDIRNFCRLIAAEGVKKQILEQGRATFVVRPDSGDPRQIVHDVFEILGDEFGAAINGKGFKVLPNGVRVIQGDGVNYHSIIEILQVMVEAKWSTENIVFGCGGKLLQASTRDTQRFAFKASDLTMAPVGELEEYHLPISKDPITDHGKKSMAGRLRLIKNAKGRLRTIQQGPGSQFPDQLVEVYRDGELLVNHTLDDIRERVKVPGYAGT
jgi:nicotinamide phosphoribosyltransferase